MAKVLTRYDVQVNSENEQIDFDLILNSDNKKIICGTVWDDNILHPKRVPEAIVRFYLAGENYKDDPLDIYPIGYVISDASGEFIAGPFEHGTTVVLKVFRFFKYNIVNNSGNSKPSSSTNTGSETSTSGEYSGMVSGEYSGKTDH